MAGNIRSTKMQINELCEAAKCRKINNISSAAAATAIPASDICLVYNRSAIVTGFFTPDYALLASAFSKNLAQHRISHRLYARAKIAGG
jgi:hypothetical protein